MSLSNTLGVGKKNTNNWSQGRERVGGIEEREERPSENFTLYTERRRRVTEFVPRREISLLQGSLSGLHTVRPI